MTPMKRAFDIIVAILILIAAAPILLSITILVILFDGAPVLYISERMKTPTTSFRLVKFRTMRSSSDSLRATGGYNQSRVTTLGKWLRSSRLDELPQLWNILKGDMSFVGPRPPLRRYVEMCDDTYEKVLRNRPGVTGLASLLYHHHEEWLLKDTSDPSEAEDIYCRICVPQKAKIDLIYQRHSSLCFDITIMFTTVLRRLKPLLHRR